MTGLELWLMISALLIGLGVGIRIGIAWMDR